MAIDRVRIPADSGLGFENHHDFLQDDEETRTAKAAVRATDSRPSSRPFSQAGLGLDTGRVPSPSQVDSADVTTSIIREYGVRRNAVQIVVFDFGWPQAQHGPN